MCVRLCACVRVVVVLCVDSPKVGCVRRPFAMGWGCCLPDCSCADRPSKPHAFAGGLRRRLLLRVLLVVRVCVWSLAYIRVPCGLVCIYTPIQLIGCLVLFSWSVESLTDSSWL